MFGQSIVTVWPGQAFGHLRFRRTVSLHQTPESKLPSGKLDVVDDRGKALSSAGTDLKDDGDADDGGFRVFVIHCVSGGYVTGSDVPPLNEFTI